MSDLGYLYIYAEPGGFGGYPPRTFAENLYVSTINIITSYATPGISVMTTDLNPVNSTRINK